MKLKILILLFLAVSVEQSFTQQNIRVFIQDFLIDLEAIESIEYFYETRTFQSMYQGYLSRFQQEIAQVNNSQLILREDEAEIIISSRVTIEGDYLKFTIGKIDAVTGTITKEEFFLVDMYLDPDKIDSLIEYNTKSILCELFDISWLIISQGDMEGVSRSEVRVIEEMLGNELLKTKKALIFDPAKNEEIAAEMEEKACIDVECITEAAPFLYILSLRYDRLEGDIRVSCDLSKGGQVIRRDMISFSQDNLAQAYNKGEPLSEITDSAFTLMDVYNIDYLNTRLSEIKRTARTTAFAEATVICDDLLLKFDKQEFKPILSEYKTFTINAQEELSKTIRENNLRSYPLIFGGMTLGLGILGGVFSYYHGYNSSQKDIALGDYNNAQTTLEAQEYRELYNNYLSKQNMNLAVLSTSFSGAGISLVTGIVGEIIRIRRIRDTKERLVQSVDELPFMEE
jgi:hypothetical protein